VERLLHETLASVHRNIMRPIWVSLKRETKFFPYSNDFLHAFSFFLCFDPTSFILGQRGCACIVVEVTQAWQATPAVEATCATTMLAVETSASEAVAVQDSATLCVKDAVNRATLVERVSRAEVENATALASTHKNVEGFAWKTTLLEDELTRERRTRKMSERERRAQFEELSLM
jgi:hypothetical protein